MAISSYCSLNFPAPPTTSASSPIPITPQVSCPPTVKERSWRNRCLLGLTCAIIGLDAGGEFAAVGDQDRAMAMEMRSGSTAVIIRAPRWSDKRACLPWRINSLETIVPENLPRPSARRRWGATGFSETAPPVKVVVKSGAEGCFSL